MNLLKASLSTALYAIILAIQIIILTLAITTNRFEMYHILNLAFAAALVYKSLEIDRLKLEKKDTRRED